MTSRLSKSNNSKHDDCTRDSLVNRGLTAVLYCDDLGRVYTRIQPRLYPVVSLVAVYMYPVSVTKSSLTRHDGDMYPLVSGYKLLVWDTCIRLHVSGVNAALGFHLGRLLYMHRVSLARWTSKARFPLPELTARVNGPSWQVTGFRCPSTRAVLTGAL